MKSKIKLILSWLFGILGMISLFLEWNVIYYDTPFTFIGEMLQKLIRSSSFLIATIIGYYIFFAFLFVAPLSLTGLFLAIRTLNYKRRLAMASAILNLLTFLLSLFIAWLLFGLARGL